MKIKITRLGKNPAEYIEEYDQWIRKHRGSNQQKVAQVQAVINAKQGSAFVFGLQHEYAGESEIEEPKEQPKPVLTVEEKIINALTQGPQYVYHLMSASLTKRNAASEWNDAIDALIKQNRIRRDKDVFYLVRK